MLIDNRITISEKWNVGKKKTTLFISELKKPMGEDANKHYILTHYLLSVIFSPAIDFQIKILAPLSLGDMRLLYILYIGLAKTII